MIEFSIIGLTAPPHLYDGKNLNFVRTKSWSVSFVKGQESKSIRKHFDREI